MRRAVAVIGLVMLSACARNEEPRVAPKDRPPVAMAAPEVDLESAAAMISATGESCNVGLWKHVYHGTFAQGKDRLSVIEPCKTITGTIMHAASEDDGDLHIRVKLDPPFESMLNAKNKSGQHGHFVVEPMCVGKVKQRDTLAEKACTGFSQTLYDAKTMKGRHVEITGAYVTDMEHGWNEIHPVTSIKIVP